jgi:hypothetical protein
LKILTKILPLLTLAAIMLQVAAPCVLAVKKHIAIELAAERLEKESLTSVTLPINNIVWEKPNKELRIGNSFFDVKYYTNNNNTITFFGLYDQQEKKIEELAQKMLDDDDASKSKPSKTKKIPSNIFYEVVGLNQANTVFNVNNTAKIYLKNTSIVSQFLPTNTLPPWC